VICNINPYNAEVAKDQIDDIINEKNITASSFNSYIEYLDEVNFQLKSIFRKLAETNKTFDLKQNGFQLEQMLISCQYDLSPCSVSDFEWFYNFDYGNCYRFNGKKPLRVAKQSGELNGLRYIDFY
jgi:hypothetical protein